VGISFDSIQDNPLNDVGIYPVVIEELIVEIKKVGVLGLGTMGAGIAQVFAQGGLTTIGLEINEELIDKGIERINKFLKILLRKKEINEDEIQDILNRIKGTTDINEFRDCDLIIEAVVEDLLLKQDLFRQLDDVCEPQAIFATNTSSLSVTEIGSVTNRQDRIIGMHFFNPVPLMKLVEIAATVITDPEVVDTAYNCCEKIGKVPIKTVDSPGFVVNRLLVPYLNDAAKAVESKLASVEDIDKAMVYGLGYPMGPLKLMDTIGLDVCVMVSEIMYNAFKDPKYAVPPILKNMVKGGLHGKKSGRGFYTYARPKKE
jgi:3-hydroxybutyryl-CoA dehydrogenase